LDKCVQEIRDIPGFEGFRLSFTSADSQIEASNELIAVINFNEIRRNVLLVSGSGLKLIPLPNMQISRVWAWLEHHLSRYESLEEYGNKNQNFNYFLSWLW
jgi:hypothetical protein